LGAPSSHMRSVNGPLTMSNLIHTLLGPM